MVSDFQQLAMTVGNVLNKKHLKLVTAESCTGGWVAEVLTAMPGASEWFDRGFVTYSIESKQELLAVPQELIEQQGVVSEAVAKAMAEGALKNSHAQLSLAITGIAGPSGGSAIVPVGTVCFAWANQLFQTKTVCQQFNGDRESIRAQAVECALNNLLNILQRIA